MASAAFWCLLVALCVTLFTQGLAPIDNLVDQGYHLVLGRPAVICSRLEPSAFDADDVEKMVSEWEVLAALGIPPDREQEVFARMQIQVNRYISTYYNT